MKKSFALIICSLLLIATTSAQTKTVKGFIYDETGEALIGASLYLSDNSSIGVTDVDGRFEVEVPETEKILIISYLGYQTQKMFIVCEDCEHKVALQYDTNVIEELIVTNCFPVKEPTIFSSFETIALEPLQINNSTNILPLLNSLTGVYVHSGALNTNRIIIRGIGARSPFSTRNIKMYYNDIPITSGDGESLMEDLDVSTFDRVSVLKGPFSSHMGAPLGGGILLSNRDFFSNSSLTSDVSVGSFGLWRNTNRFQLALKKASIQFFQNTTLSDGFRQNNEYTRRSGGMNGIIDLNSDHKLSFIAHYTDLFGQIPSSINEEDYLNAPEKAAFNWLSTAGYEDYNRAIFGINHTYEGDNDGYGGGRYEIINSIFSNIRNNYEVRPFNILNENVSNFGWRPFFTYDNYDWNDFFINAGAEMLFENYEWQTYENENNGDQGVQIANNLENRQYYNIFSTAKMTFFEKLAVSTGFNLNKTQYQLEDKFTNDTIDQSGNHVYDWIFSPKIGLNYALSHEINFFANVSHGFSMPSVEETLLPDGLINPDLQPETGWNFEVGSEGYFDKLRLQYQVNVYRMAIQNLIVADRIDADSYVGINAGATQHDGIEAKLEYADSWVRVEANYSLNNYIFKDFIDDGEDFSGNKLTGVPSNTFNTIVQFRTYRFPLYATLNYRFVDAIPIFDNNSLFTESYQTLDFKVGYDYEIDKLTISAYFGVNNILDEKYASMVAINPRSFGGNPPRIYYPGLPRNFYGGIKVRFEMYQNYD